MAFKKIQDLNCDITIALGGRDKKTGKANLSQLEGYFLGSRTVTTKKGPAKLHAIQTSDGVVGVWGKTDLNRKMENAIVGAMTRITQKGTVETPNGPMYKYTVEVDEDNSVEVFGLNSNTSDSAASNSSDDRSSEESYDEVDDEEETESEESSDEVVTTRAKAPVVPASTPSASAKARVQALLAAKTRQ
jgi:hypothetical protein